MKILIQLSSHCFKMYWIFFLLYRSYGLLIKKEKKKKKEKKEKKVPYSKRQLYGGKTSNAELSITADYATWDQIKLA